MRKLIAVVAALTAMGAHAEVRLPSVFGDHMVLQGGVPVPVWGTAAPGETVTVSIAGQTKTARTGDDHKWKVMLDPLTATDPVTLTVAGKNTVTFKDVLAGEVWLCSGQSNMVLPVSKARDFEQEKAGANWPRIRVNQTKWVECSPQTVGAFSATAYFFGRELHRKTGRPVGLIMRAAGGSPIELWTRLEAQQAVPELKPILNDAGPAAGQAEAGQAEIDRKQASEVEGKKAVAGLKRPPGYLFEDRIAPLIPYAIRGVIWYQGEANSYTARANLYGLQLATMITHWRKQWGSGIPFISVQLPDFGKPQVDPVEADSGRAWVREGVRQSLRLPGTGMAVTLGTGEAANNHPVNKQEVGRRLACWALVTVYGQKDVAASGPLYEGCRITDGKAVLRFTHVAGGLVAKGGDLKGFAVSGSDGIWKWGHATIVGETVVVSCPEVPKPVAVRYAWAGNPAGANLFNSEELPASPFRTDGP